MTRAAAGGEPARLAEAVRRHRAGDLAEAEHLYRRILRTAPRNADALHLLGVVCHQRGDHRRARELIERAIAVRDDDASFHNNLGTVLLAVGAAAEAADRFRSAIALSPAYAEARNNLGNALQTLGEIEAAIDAYRAALAVRADYAEAHCNLGQALHALGDLEAAAGHYRRALELRADYVKARRRLGNAEGELGRPEAAEAAYRKALEADPADADTLAALAALWERASRLEDALGAAEAAIRHRPDCVRAIVVAARCERRLGRLEAAWARLEAAGGMAADDEMRAFALFERGTLADRQGDHAGAFRCFAEANRLVLEGGQGRRVDRTLFPRQIEALARRFTPDWVRSWTPPAAPAGAQPVFLIGFPRSGTTLLDQVLDVHPALAAIEEKPMLDVVKHHLEARSEGYPDALQALAADDIAALREIYFAEAARHLRGRTDRVIVDKMPLNTIDVGLIHRLFPDARILLALRHPCDVVLSGFMQAFKPNAAMVHFATLADTARLYAAVMGLWLRYAEVLPLSWLAVRYEDLIADFPAETARVLAFLGVPWDDAVLAYAEHARSRAIATPSYHQVVQPIYARSVGRWRTYRQELEPVLPILAPFISAFGYSTDAPRRTDEYPSGP